MSLLARRILTIVAVAGLGWVRQRVQLTIFSETIHGVHTNRNRPTVHMTPRSETEIGWTYGVPIIRVESPIETPSQKLPCATNPRSPDTKIPALTSQKATISNVIT